MFRTINEISILKHFGRPFLALGNLYSGNAVYSGHLKDFSLHIVLFWHFHEPGFGSQNILGGGGYGFKF